MRITFLIATLLLLNTHGRGQQVHYYKIKVINAVSTYSPIIYQNKKVGRLKTITCHGHECSGELELTENFKILDNMKFFNQQSLLGDPVIIIELDKVNRKKDYGDTIQIMDSPKNKFMFNGVVQAITNVKGGYVAVIKRPFDNKAVSAFISKLNLSVLAHYRRFKVGDTVTIYGDRIKNKNVPTIIVHDIEQ